MGIVAKETNRRRVPSQARGRERVARILDAASELVERDGSGDLKMAEVASRAGVPIGSVYQYFPNRSAVVRELAERFHRRVRQALADELSDVGDTAGTIVTLDRALERYYELCVNEPVFRDVWLGTQADKALQEIEIAESRANGRLIFEVLEPLVPDHKRARLKSTCFLLTHLAGGAIGLAISVGRQEGDELWSEFRGLIRLSVTDLTGP